MMGWVLFGIVALALIAGLRMLAKSGEANRGTAQGKTNGKSRSGRPPRGGDSARPSEGLASGRPPVVAPLPPIHEPLQVSGHRSSVLLVEDSATARLAMKRLLEERGYRVQVAENGRLGWVQLQKERPDLVISDIDMPELNGLELLRLIRGDIKLSGLPVVLVTGNPYFYMQVGQEEGVSGFLPKPFADDDLIQQVQFLLQE